MKISYVLKFNQIQIYSIMYFAIKTFNLKINKLLIIIFLFFSSIIFSQDYNYIYDDVKRIPNKKYISINELHNTIVKPYYNDIEKVYAFAKFITDKIAYGKRARTPLNTINTMEGVCQDYSELFKELCEISSIENNYVAGMGTTNSSLIGEYDSNHAWNVVKVNGKYMIFDLTWAAGYGEGDAFVRRFNPKYFNSNPKDFIRDHFPNDTKWQLLDKPVSKKDYVNAPLYDSEFENLSLKDAVVIDSKVEITFNSNIDFTEATLFKWKLNEYGTVTGKSLDFIKRGNFYRILIEENVPGAYNYDLSFKNDSYLEIESVTKNNDGSSTTTYKPYSSPTIMFKLITPNYSVPKPSSYDKNDPWGLIEAYHYIFHKNDFNFFKKLNPNTTLRDLNYIKYSQSLNKSLSNWYGNYRKFYTNMGGGDIFYKIDNFRIVLSLEEDGYNFKELVRETLSLGKTGYGVNELQKIFGLEETGDFDNTLQEKIKEFQKQNGLTVDGIVGRMTYEKLGI